MRDLRLGVRADRVTLLRAMSNDPLLLPLMRAADGREAQRCVEELIERHARPVVRDIVQRKVRRRAGWGDVIEAAADVEADVVAQLIARLRELRARDASDASAPVMPVVPVMRVLP